MSSNNESSEKPLFNFHVGDAVWGNVFRKDSGEKASTISLLRKVPIFKGMRRTELVELEKIIHRRNYHADETIFYEGEPGVGMYVIQEGSIGIYKEQPRDERELLAELNQGEFFGELALLDESPRSATAVALEECRILGLFRPDLMELIERKPRLGNKLLFQLAHMIGERLKHTNDELQAVWAKLDEAKVIT